MKMQRTTAMRLITEINAALEASEDNIIILPESVKALISDSVARNDLTEAIANKANS